jgi:hypothetical protein
MSTIAVTNLKHESASGNNITLDSSNRVGIGTGSPTQKLHVESAGTNYILSKDSTSGGIAGVICQNGSDTRGIRINNANLELYDFSAALARVVVDSAGRVTMPYQPSFSVTRTDGDTATNSFHIGNLAILNNGGHYNTTTGRFTAPVAGVYAFHCYFMASGSSNDIAISAQFWKNGSALSNSVPYTRANGESFAGMAGHVIISLAVNDYVELRNAGATGWYGTGTGHNAFSGHLIG